MLEKLTGAFSNDTSDHEAERRPIDELTGEETRHAIDYLNLLDKETTTENIEWAAYQLQADEVGLGKTIEAIREEGGDPRLLRKTGTSDMNVYATEWNCPMVTYGPGDSSLDHTPTERLPLDEFDRAVEVLNRVCDRLL